MEQLRRRREYQKQAARPQQQARKQAQEQPNAAPVTRHRCAVCGRTELDHPELEFRFCSKCNGNYEYCQDHLFSHRHVE